MCVIRIFYILIERNKMLLILVNLEKAESCQKWPHLTLKWIGLTFSLISWPENKKTETFGQSNDQIRSTDSAWGSNSKIIYVKRTWIYFLNWNFYSILKITLQNIPKVWVPGPHLPMPSYDSYFGHHWWRHFLPEKFELRNEKKLRQHSIRSLFLSIKKPKKCCSQSRIGRFFTTVNNP